MTTTQFRILASVSAMALLSAAGAITSASAQTYSLNFDFNALPTGVFSPGAQPVSVSFNNAKSIYETIYADEDDVFGTEVTKWIIDTEIDDDYPVSILDDGNTAGGNALFAYDGPVIISFDQLYDLTAFSTTLDLDDNFLYDVSVLFLRDGVVVSTLALDTNTPGYVASLSSPVNGINGFVLPGSEYYEKLSFTLSATVVPEPATWVAIIGGLALSVALVVRRRSARVC
ncbi:PEP-CTERM sorting domain-containing protein [Geminisphaera colitermitum]|uniref:PEP-CTERM sorting domain-containing protein n=1 Tax=Geminisphaera colitermitum TaxID=1148786 RepID=UPI000196540D|nr:PEP-CTERM sorting domain-containing protein [Geminisphaera colitermitum]